MGRGLVIGLLVGGLVSGAGVSVISLMAPPISAMRGGETEAGGAEPAETGATAPEAPVVEVPAGSEFASARPDEEPVLSGLEPAPEGASAPAVEIPETEAAPDLPEVTAAAAPEGQTVAPAGIAVPEPAAADAAAPTIDSSAPIPPSGVEAAPALDAAAAADPAAEIATANEAPAGEAGGDEGPVILDFTPQPPIGVASAPQPGFSSAVPGVRANRLPRIGDAESEAAAASEEPEGDAPAPANAAELPAVARYAMPFENPEAKPLVGVVLLDAGKDGGTLDADALAAIGLPVTIAINPLSEGAGARVRAYRAAGLEVALLAPELPEGVTAKDLEVSYQGFVRKLPEAVALIGEPDAAFQSDRRIAQHLVALLGAEGRGLITYDRGLNPARQAAQGAGLAHAQVFRALDAEGESPDAIRRHLDRAGFDAARLGQVLVVGHGTQATVQALTDWAAAGAKGAIVAPVSAMMAAGS